MCGMLSRAVPAAEALTDCLSPSQSMDTQSNAAPGMVLSEFPTASGNINACLEERDGKRGGEKTPLNGWNFHSALAGAGGNKELLHAENLLGVALDRKKKMSAGRKPS